VLANHFSGFKQLHKLVLIGSQVSSVILKGTVKLTTSQIIKVATMFNPMMNRDQTICFTIWTPQEPPWTPPLELVTGRKIVLNCS